MRACPECKKNAGTRAAVSCWACGGTGVVRAENGDPKDIVLWIHQDDLDSGAPLA